jgi:hypothetical protein
VEKYCTAGQATEDNMAHAHRILVTTATKPHSEYVIIIVFTLQQWFQDRASMLLYMCTAFLAHFCFISDITNK